jgi:hypothetical protein
MRAPEILRLTPRIRQWTNEIPGETRMSHPNGGLVLVNDELGSTNLDLNT